MPAVASFSWLIAPSRQQCYVDQLSALCLALLVAVIGSALWSSVAAQWLWWGSVLSTLSVLVFYLRYAGRKQPSFWLHRDAQGWWQDDGSGYWQPLALHAGSVKRPDLVIWQYRRWPWRRWLLRPDCFTHATEFQRFRRVLYPDL